MNLARENATMTDVVTTYLVSQNVLPLMIKWFFSAFFVGVLAAFFVGVPCALAIIAFNVWRDD